jgi:hypothetical protein
MGTDCSREAHSKREREREREREEREREMITTTTWCILARAQKCEADLWDS